VTVSFPAPAPIPPLVPASQRAGATESSRAQHQPEEPHYQRAPTRLAPRVCSLLDLDPSFGRGLSPHSFQQARRHALVRVLDLAGPRHARKVWQVPAGEGMLLLEGMVARQTIVADRCSLELLGEGDVMQAADEVFSAFSSSRCQTLIPGRVAVLDAGFLDRVARWPSIAFVLAQRLARQGRILAALAATSRMRRVDDRLRLLFSVLAEPWGRVTPRGVRLQLPLTHDLLGQMVGARRPSVTTALAALRAEGAIERLGRGHWLLPGTTEPTEWLSRSSSGPTRRSRGRAEPSACRDSAMIDDERSPAGI
jgi:CRP/FNR family transcriptional regulator, cyclic AMP receptor protein